MDKTSTERTGPFFFRPLDKSLEAYKQFILAMTRALNPDAKEEWTEEKWREAWKEFWAAANKHS